MVSCSTCVLKRFFEHSVFITCSWRSSTLWFYVRAAFWFELCGNNVIRGTQRQVAFKQVDQVSRPVGASSQWMCNQQGEHAKQQGHQEWSWSRCHDEKHEDTNMQSVRSFHGTGRIAVLLPVLRSDQPAAVLLLLKSHGCIVVVRRYDAVSGVSERANHRSALQKHQAVFEQWSRQAARRSSEIAVQALPGVV